jgi:Holliday junction resolvase RusA-like endonuclease
VTTTLRCLCGRCRGRVIYLTAANYLALHQPEAPMPAARTLMVNVRGLPRPQGSLRLHKLPNGGTAARYPAVVYAWRAQVQQAVADACLGAEPFLGAVEVGLGFDLPRPMSHFGTGRNAGHVKASATPHPTVAPDLDKLARCINDAITDAGAWKDDAQVVRLYAAKRYVTTTPGVLITITEAEVPDL